MAQPAISPGVPGLDRHANRQYSLDPCASLRCGSDCERHVGPALRNTPRNGRCNGDCRARKRSLLICPFARRHANTLGDQWLGAVCRLGAHRANCLGLEYVGAPRNVDWLTFHLLLQVGHVLSWLLAGALCSAVGWRAAFMVPGLVLLPSHWCFSLFLRIPPRKRDSPCPRTTSPGIG